MSIRTISRKLFLTIITIILVAVMIKLGLWQLTRAQEKLQRKSLIESQSKLMPITINSQIDESTNWQFRRVIIEGEYLSEDGILLDNVVHNHKAGVSVITPIMINSTQQIILIDRGWIGWPQQGLRIMPEIQTPNQLVTVQGILVPISDYHFYLTDRDEIDDELKLWSQLDLQRFREKTQHNLIALKLILNADQPGSYLKIYKPMKDHWVTRHKAYAVQWFSLALVLTLLYLFYSYKYRNIKKKDE